LAKLAAEKIIWQGQLAEKAQLLPELAAVLIMKVGGESG